MQLNDLKRKNPNQKARQVGRGGTRGKTSGRGGKGQTARAGNKRRPQLRDMIKKIPKLRGYRFNSTVKKFTPVNVEALNLFENGVTVNPTTLVAMKIVRRISGKAPTVKILGNGEISRKLIIEKCEVSKIAKEKIQKAGGEIKVK